MFIVNIIKLLLLCGIITTSSSSFVESANILFLLPVPSSAHRLWNSVLIEGLAERGHNLTVLTVETERSRQNVTFICMKKIYESLNEFRMNDDAYDALHQKSSYKIIKENYERANYVSRKIFESQGLQQLRSYPQTFKFDVIIYDYTMAQALLAFVAHFNYPPLISISPQAHPMRLSSASSTQIFASYIAHYSTASTAKSLRESIRERFMNGFVYYTFDWFHAKYVYMKNENRRASKVFEMSDKLKLEQLEQSELVLINRNFPFDDALPLPPNVIPVAGIQAQRKNEIQNYDVIELLKHSQKPIIVFSLGSSMLAEDLGFGIMHEIMAAFRRLNDDFNIICKCNEKFIRKSSQPQNVLFVEWMQQNELLANAKVAAIISSGGILTIQEAIWHEKPILGMPIQTDQRRHIERAIEMGFAESINLYNFTSIEIAIKLRMLTEKNSIYQVNVRKAAMLMKSRPMMPKETAIYWIEQVLLHKGLKHLQCESRYLSFYKLYMIDIITFIATIMLIYILIMQYHLVKGWILNRERKAVADAATAAAKDKDDTNDKLKNE